MTIPVKKRIGLGLAALLFCGGVSQGAWAQVHGGGHGHGGGGFHGHGGGGFHGHGGGSHFGFFIGAPWFWGYPYSYYPYYSYPYYPDPYYSYPPYYYPPISQSVIQQPPVYVQRNDTAPSAPPANYWYYCTNPQGYYPNVQDCPEGWMQVAPQPPQPPQPPQR